MTGAASLGDDVPRAQLALARDLERQVRRDQRTTWFPLLAFAVVTYVAIPVTSAGHAAGLVRRETDVAEPLGARVCVAHNSAAFVYWPIALIVAYALIASFYLRLSRGRGSGRGCGHT